MADQLCASCGDPIWDATAAPYCSTPCRLAMMAGVTKVLTEIRARHLHESGEARTLCGWDRGGAVRSVHVTKARKTDCNACRNAFRAQVRDRSGREYETRAEAREASI
jgi:hypothetical protein